MDSNADEAKAWIDIRVLRKERGWLQRDAAAQLGISRAHLSAVENGNRGFSLNLINAAMRVFGVKYEDFYSCNGKGE